VKNIRNAEIWVVDSRTRRLLARRTVSYTEFTKFTVHDGETLVSARVRLNDQDSRFPTCYVIVNGQREEYEDGVREFDTHGYGKIEIIFYSTNPPTPPRSPSLN